MTVAEAIQVALQHHQAGRLAQAEALYRQVLAVQPVHTDALNLLGMVAYQAGRFDAAEELIQRAIHFNPAIAVYHGNLGLVLAALHRTGAAVASYRTALRLKPDYAEAHNNLGNVLFSEGRLDEAMDSFRLSIAYQSNYPEAYINMGNALCRQGSLEEAMDAFQTALRQRPGYPLALNSLGNALLDSGKTQEAVNAYRAAVASAPAYAEAHSNLGNALKDQGALDEAIACLRRAVDLHPANAAMHSNLVYALHFQPGCAGATIRAEADEWNRRHALPLKASAIPHRNDSSPDRRLRIGYVSPDFREHVVGRNVLPLMKHHSHDAFEIVCYSDVRRDDAVTAQFRACADSWRDIARMSDAALVEMIRADRIDVLVDLALHMAHNRLLAFARQPAPVQITFAGYPGTTGLDTVPYRLTDPFLDPPGVYDEFYREESVRLPHSFWCYEPRAVEPAVNDLPALARGKVTFGCLNNFCKVNERTLSCWARILNAVPGSSLRLLAPSGNARTHVTEFLRHRGVDAARVQFVENCPPQRFLELHWEIDVILDTYPYNGHTTSLDALWMGVPVVSLAGEQAISRAGWSQMSNLGLPEFVANSEEEYVSLAVRVTGDLARLAELRATLRRRMEASALMDARGFARDVETAYRSVWRRWCAQG